MGNRGPRFGLLACALASACSVRTPLDAALSVVPLPSGTGAASSVVDAAPAQPTPYPGRVVLGHDTQGVSLAQLQGAPDGALLAYLRVLPAAAPGRETGPCEALRLDAQGQASIVTTTCPSWDDLPSPDGAKIVRLVTRPALAALMAPSRDVFVEDATTHERWFVDHGWMQGLDREASIVWNSAESVPTE